MSSLYQNLINRSNETYATPAECTPEKDAAYRRQLGLRPMEPAIRDCLSCSRKFRSEDKRLNRICEACKTTTEYRNGDREHEWSNVTLVAGYGQ